LLYDGKLIVEQKEYEESVEQIAKGRYIENLYTRLMKKYNVDSHSNPGTKQFERLHALMSKEESDELRKFKDKFYNKIKALMHKANGQIGYTKEAVGKPDSIGCSS
jgi:hypothetical protein